MGRRKERVPFSQVKDGEKEEGEGQFVRAQQEEEELVQLSKGSCCAVSPC